MKSQHKKAIAIGAGVLLAAGGVLVFSRRAKAAKPPALDATSSASEPAVQPQRGPAVDNGRHPGGEVEVFLPGEPVPGLPPPAALPSNAASAEVLSASTDAGGWHRSTEKKNAPSLRADKPSGKSSTESLIAVPVTLVDDSPKPAPVMPPPPRSPSAAVAPAPKPPATTPAPAAPAPSAPTRRPGGDDIEVLLRPAPAAPAPKPPATTPAPAKPAAAPAPTVVTRAPLRAALDLYSYAKERIDRGQGSTLGTKGNPNFFVLQAQRDMGGMLEKDVDGVYALATRARGKALTGKPFPARV